MSVNIVTIKWGPKYGPHYVNRLYSAVERNLNRSFKFVCFTDDTRDIRSEVDVYPLPEINSKALNYLTKPYKIGLFTNNIGDLQGSYLFLDLNTVVVRSIDCFFDYLPSQFCICKEWLPPNKVFLNSITGKQASANSSVFQFEANSMQFVVDDAERTPELLKQLKLEQRWLSYIAGEQMNWWPSSWVSSFKHRRPVYPLSLIFPPVLPKNSRVVTFNGPLKPSHAVEGNIQWSPRRVCRPSQWVVDNWID